MSATSLWGQLKTAAAAGILAGGRPFARNILYVGDNAPTFGVQYNTIADALAAMVAGDVLFLGPQTFAEGNLVIPATLTNITIIGAGPRGSCAIEPVATGDEGLQVLGDDVTLVNVGVAKGSTADYALAVGSNLVSPDRFRAYGCKFEGDGVAVKLWGAGDLLMDDCEFAWCGTGIQLSSNAIGFCTQIRVRNSLFQNFTDVGVGEAAAAQQVNNLWLTDNVFDQQEDGTEPTDFILLSDNGNTGIISGNRFAIATNASAKLTIGSGLMWVANATEAGWSTARPA